MKIIQRGRDMMVNTLAVLGGKPAFRQPLHVGRPNVGNQNDFVDRARRAMDTRRLTNDGPFVKGLEARICKMLQAKHCIAVANATLGLQLVAGALGLAGEVIVPSFSFIATANALLWDGITPVFADIDPRTHCLDPKSVQDKITDRTSGICGVHVWGNPCAVEELQIIADAYGLKLYFDAAHAFCCAGPGKMLGNYGEAEVFSFHATKFFNTFEGGAITTNDDDLAQHLRMMRNFGFPGGGAPPRCLGINAKMNEISAAMGLTNLDFLKEFMNINYVNHKLYCQLLEDIPGIMMIDYRENYAHNYQYVVMEFVNEFLDADDLQAILQAENILARRYFSPPCHETPPYSITYHLPITDMVARRTLALPTGTAVHEDDIIKICDIIRYVVENAEKIDAQLPRLID